MQDQTIRATKYHCAFCFNVLQSLLKEQKQPQWPKQLPDAQVPIFVTWKINGQLRGCIGTFQAGKLSTILAKYAETAAMKDSRFDPIQLSELKYLSVGVSLLVNFENGKKAYDWEVGKHGIIIQAIVKGKNYQATFLPEVAKQQEWSKEETLKHLARKSGYNGNFQEFIENMSITTYESSKQYLSFIQYQEMKESKK